MCVICGFSKINYVDSKQNPQSTLHEVAISNEIGEWKRHVGAVTPIKLPERFVEVQIETMIERSVYGKRCWVGCCRGCGDLILSSGTWRQREHWVRSMDTFQRDDVMLCFSKKVVTHPLLNPFLDPAISDNFHRSSTFPFLRKLLRRWYEISNSEISHVWQFLNLSNLKLCELQHPASIMTWTPWEKTRYFFLKVHPVSYLPQNCFSNEPSILFHQSAANSLMSWHFACLQITSLSFYCYLLLSVIYSNSNSCLSFSSFFQFIFWPIVAFLQLPLFIQCSAT